MNIDLLTDFNVAIHTGSFADSRGVVQYCQIRKCRSLGDTEIIVVACRDPKAAEELQAHVALAKQARSIVATVSSRSSRARAWQRERLSSSSPDQLA